MDRKPDDKKDVKKFDLSDQMQITSSTECTGMVPTPPQNDAEVDGYSDLFHVMQQKVEYVESTKRPNDKPKKP